MGVVGTGDDAKMTDGEGRGVIETINERYMVFFSLKVDASCGSGLFGKEITLLRMGRLDPSMKSAEEGTLQGSGLKYKDLTDR